VKSKADGCVGRKSTWQEEVMTRLTLCVMLLLSSGCTPRRPAPSATWRCPADASLGRHTCAEVHPLDGWDEETERDLVHGRDCDGRLP